MPNNQYVALRTKLDAFSKSVSERQSAEMACRAGCADCCQAGLSVCAVEAQSVSEGLRELAPIVRDALAQRIEENSAQRCVMLDEDDRCVIYANRPLVCRSQGLPLRYGLGTLPEETVVATELNGDITHCPLNFQNHLPESDDILDAERINLMLALINQASLDRPTDRADDSEETLERFGLLELAEAAVDADPMRNSKKLSSRGVD